MKDDHSRQNKALRRRHVFFVGDLLLLSKYAKRRVFAHAPCRWLLTPNGAHKSIHSFVGKVAMDHEERPDGSHRPADESDHQQDAENGLEDLAAEKHANRWQ